MQIHQDVSTDLKLSATAHGDQPQEHIAPSKVCTTVGTTEGRSGRTMLSVLLPITGISAHVSTTIMKCEISALEENLTR
jgi:hypothetical protein